MPGYKGNPTTPILNVGHSISDGVVLAMPLGAFGFYAPDLSGRGNYGTINGSPFVNNWKQGRCFDFDGNDVTKQYIQIPTSGDFDFRSYTQDWTVSILVDTDDTTNRMHFAIGTADYQCICIYFENNQTIKCVASSNGSTWTLNLVGPVASANTLYHVMVSNTGGTYRLYVDGDLKATDTESSNLYLNTYSVKIGAHYNLVSGWNFDGRIGGVTVWNRSLSFLERSVVFADPFIVVRIPLPFVALYQDAVPVLPTDGVEILYPIQPIPQSNILVHSTDSREWNYVQKSSTVWRREFVTLRYRIRDTYRKAFVNALEQYKGQIVQLSTPGLQPFIRTNTSNNVYISTWTNPVLELPKHYTMSVTYFYYVKEDS